MIKSTYKNLVRRATRSAFVETEQSLSAIEQRLDDIDRRMQSQTGAVWRGTLATGAAVSADGMRHDELTEKYRGELAFWVSLVKEPEKFPHIEEGYERAFSGWQRERGHDDENRTLCEAGQGGRGPGTPPLPG